MARTTVFQAESVTVDKTPFLAIVKYLRDDEGELERVKGGLWVPLSGETDAVLARLTNACEQALAFATACESKHAEIIRVADAKLQPKAPRAPKNPPPAPKSTSNGFHVVEPLTGADLTPATPATPAHKTPEREKIIAKAREDRAKLATNGVSKVGSTTRDTGKQAPALSPEEQAEADWLRLLGA